MVVDAAMPIVNRAICQPRELGMMYVKKVDVVAFNATVKLHSSSIKELKEIGHHCGCGRKVSGAAGKYLELQEFTAEDLQRLLAVEDVLSS